MSKAVKITLIIAAAAIVLAGGVVAFIFLFPWASTALIDNDQAAAIRANRTAVADAGALTTLRINGVAAIYEQTENTFYFTLNTEESWEAMSFAAGEEDGSAIGITEDYRQLDKDKTITKGNGIPVILYNDTQYRDCTLVFSTLPMLSIRTEQLPADLHYEDEAETLAEWNAAKHKEDELPPDDHAAPPDDADRPVGENNVYAKIALLDAQAAQHGYENGYTSKARIHVRGRSSAQYPKNSYKLELLKKDDITPTTLVERNLTMLGMRKDGDWILNGMYAEATKVRDKLASDLWLKVNEDRTAVGLSDGWHTEYIEVFINGRYWGLYLIGERIDKKQLGLTNGDFMYFSEADNGKRASDFEDTGAKTLIKGYELSYPLPMQEPYNEWNAFHDLVDLVQSSAIASEKKVDALINTDSLVNYWVYVQAVYGVDNLIQNTYYISYAADGGRFSFVPWDMDQTFGWGWTAEPPLNTGPRHMDSHEQLLDFWVSERLKATDTGGIKEEMATRYATLRESVLNTKSMCEMARENHDRIIDSGAFNRNKERWPDGAYDSTTTQVTQFIGSHMSYLDWAIPAMSGKEERTKRLWR